MKHLIILLFLSVGVVNAQDRQIMSLGVDPQLLLNGAYNYDNTPVLHIHFSWLSSLESGSEIGVNTSFANLKPYDYFDYNFIYNRKIRLINNNKIETLVGGNVGFILRSYPKFYDKKLYFNYGLNTQLRYWITKDFGLYSKVSVNPRNDLDYYGKHKSLHYEVEAGLIISF